MIGTQPQLLKIALDPGDVIYTPDWAAADMCDYFNPSGRILEPCKGAGVFMKYLPHNAMFCEIDLGIDFFAWKEKVDWCIGNPPYRMFGKWIRHSLEIADQFVYLLPCDKPFISFNMMETVRKWGGIKEIRTYGTGGKLGFPVGFAVGAIHYQRFYDGPIYMSFYG